MIRIETGGITSFVEALQASMSETVDHTPSLSHMNVGCQLTLVNLYVNGQKRDAQFIAVCRRSKWSRHPTQSPFLARLAVAGSNAAYKIISACSNAVS